MNSSAKRSHENCKGNKKIRWDYKIWQNCCTPDYNSDYNLFGINFDYILEDKNCHRTSLDTYNLFGDWIHLVSADIYRTFGNTQVWNDWN